jgi:hypothetical protein
LDYFNSSWNLEKNLDRWVFSDRHYEELGTALLSNIDKGREYSLRFWTKSSPVQKDPIMHQSMTYLGPEFVIDATAVKTPYIKELISCRSKLMQFLAEYSENPDLVPNQKIRDWIREHL